MLLKILYLLLFVQKCLCVFHPIHGESEIETNLYRMPPLFNLDTNYDECLKEKDGLYCVGNFVLTAGPTNELMTMIKKYSQNDIKHYNHTLIGRAVCVTQTCKKFMRNTTLQTTEDLRMVLEGCINETIWTGYGLEAKVSQIYYCDRHDDQVVLDLGDWIFAAIFLCICALNLIGSVYDVCRQIETGNSYLLSFSIFQNWKQLSSLHTDPKYERLIGLHGIKSIITFFVLLSHGMWAVGSGYTDNPHEFELAHTRFFYSAIFSGMVIVQIFFVISGCLLIFNLQSLTETRRLTWRTTWKILFLRWARLTPSYAIMIFFTATWLRHLGSGPLWNLNVTGVVNDCRTYWWTHLLYFNNYVKEDKFCAVQTWHVAAEMQLCILGLVVYMATSSRGRYLAFAVLGLIGVVGPALHVWRLDLDALVLHKPEFYRTFDNDTYRLMHVFGHNNLSGYVIGMTTGLLAYYCVKNKIECTGRKLLKYLTWCVPLMSVGVFLSGSLFYVDGERPHILIRMAYAAVQRPALGVIIAFMVMSLIMKFEDAIRGFLEWPGWVITSRMSYSVYLLHANFIHIILGVRTQMNHISFFNIILQHFGVLCLTLVVSVPFYIMVEAPIMKILKNAALPEAEQKNGIKFKNKSS